MLDVMPLIPSLAVAGLVGATLLPAHSIVVAHVNDRSPAGAAVAVSGGLVLIQGMGAASGPLIGGFAMDLIGPRGLLFCFGAFQAVTVLFGVYRIAVLKEPDAEMRSDFVAVPATVVDGALEVMALQEDTREGIADPAGR